MNALAARKLERSAAVAGLVVVSFTAFWMLFPITPARPLEGRFAGNAVLALEFAQSVADVEGVIGEPTNTAAREALDRLNRLDALYLVAYGWLLIAGSVVAARRPGQRWLLALVPLAALASLSDLAENQVLLRLTATTSAADIAPLLGPLRAFTLVKWELLAVVTAALGLSLFLEGGWWRRLCGGAGIVAAPLGVITVFDAARFSPLLTLAFAPVWVVVFVRTLR
ncbi:MAG: hypothetical protein GQE15_22960 [Archangiaceae bacterium]|nr:hypothetical protein [Archangiaceae bacterium]